MNNLKSYAPIMILCAIVIGIVCFENFKVKYSSIEISKKNLKTFKLEFDCDVERDKNSQESQDVFTNIYRTHHWGYSPETLSGGGATLEGAFDTIQGLSNFMYEHNITKFADIPCGDVGWQFAIRPLNIIPAYFGGDITPHIVAANQQQFADHSNKLFQHWDLATCGVPKLCWNKSHVCEPFDMIIIRAAIQHIRIPRAQKAMQHAVRSGVRYIGLTSFPIADTDDIEAHERCQQKPTTNKDNYCNKGQEFFKDGQTYFNNIRCFPFNFPKPIYEFKAHVTFAENHDFFYIYDTKEQDLEKTVSRYDTDLKC